MPDADWVMAGIALGANLGVAVWRSGTVGAVRAAELLGVSICLDGEEAPEIALEGYPDRANPLEVDWQAAGLWRCFEQIAEARGRGASWLMDRLALGDGLALDEARERRDRIALDLDRKRRERILPAGPELEKIAKYERHLERGLFQSLRELQRIQALRLGSAPVLVDVTLEGEPGA